jgi:hypothetical protein
LASKNRFSGEKTVSILTSTPLQRKSKEIAMTIARPAAASRAFPDGPAPTGLRRWLALVLQARREHLASHDAIEVELLARAHAERDRRPPRTPESLRDAYRLFSGGDPLRLL